MKGILATDNLGKIAELREWLPEIHWRTQADFNLKSAPETGLSFIENAILKARHAAKASNLPALADDSGIMIDALNNRPGINSARYAGDHDFEKNIAKVLLEMQGIENRAAKFCCTLALVQKFDDPCPIIVFGFWEGLILDHKKGENGFGYDPIFYVPELKLTAAEIPSKLKNKISHRAKAIAKLRTYLHDL